MESENNNENKEVFTLDDIKIEIGSNDKDKIDYSTLKIQDGQAYEAKLVAVYITDIAMWDWTKNPIQKLNKTEKALRFIFLLQDDNNVDFSLSYDCRFKIFFGANRSNLYKTLKLFAPEQDESFFGNEAAIKDFLTNLHNELKTNPKDFFVQIKKSNSGFIKIDNIFPVPKTSKIKQGKEIKAKPTLDDVDDINF